MRGSRTVLTKPITRKIATSMVGVASIVAGVALVWLMVRPEVAAGLGTGVFVATMALLFMPVVAFAAWDWDRRIALEATRPPSPGLSPAPITVECAKSTLRMARGDPSP